MDNALTATEKKVNYLNYISCFAIIIVALVYFSTVNTYALNLPYRDDYNAILEFLNKFKLAGFGEKIALLFSQHGEHRILSSRIVYALYYTITGTINFKDIIFIANLQVVGILLLGMYFLRKCFPANWGIPAFVLGLCIFDINNFENADFAMAGMQNFGIVMLFMLSMFFYSKDNKKMLIPAVLFQLLTTYSSGSGLSASLILFLFCLLSKDKLKSIVSGATFLIFAPMYFIHYKPGDKMGSSDIGKISDFFFHMVGAHFSFEYGVICGVLLLVLLAVTLPFNKKFQFKPGTIPLLCLALFMLASFTTAALFRSSLPILQAYASRYFILNHILTALVFCFLFLKIQDHKLKWPVTIASLLLLLYAYSNNYEYGKNNFALENYRLQNMEFVFPVQEEAKKLTEDACKEGIYCIQEER